MGWRKRAAFLLLALSILFMTIPTVSAAEDPALIVVLDPGHGGTEYGAAKTWDNKIVLEKDLDLKIAQYCKQKLETDYRNVTVYMTRTGDTNPGLKERVQYAERVGADVLVSIHNNAAGDAQSWTSGAEALIPNGNYRPALLDQSKIVAGSILNQLQLHTGVQNMGFIQRNAASYYYPDKSIADYYAILRYSVEANIPSTIIEHAFMDDKNDYQQYLSSDAKLKALGEADAIGIAEAYGLRKKHYYSKENADAPFTDVFDDTWYYDSVVESYQRDLMNGTSASTFRPDDSMTRAMLVTVLWRLEGAPTVEESDDYVIPFDDVPEGRYYTDAVCWAHQYGIVNGTSPTLFCPDQDVTREQVATILYRYSVYHDYDVSGQANLDAFPDASQISEFAAQAMSWANANGLIQGTKTNYLIPRDSATRAQIAVILIRYIHNFTQT